jgi:hypothetical protein
MRRGKHLRNEALAAEWRTLREIACKYRFGRVELLPVKKIGEALARYLANYLTSAASATSSRRSNPVTWRWPAIVRGVSNAVVSASAPAQPK